MLLCLIYSFFCSNLRRKQLRSVRAAMTSQTSFLSRNVKIMQIYYRGFQDFISLQRIFLGRYFIRSSAFFDRMTIFFVIFASKPVYLFGKFDIFASKLSFPRFFACFWCVISTFRMHANSMPVTSKSVDQLRLTLVSQARSWMKPFEALLNVDQ